MVVAMCHGDHSYRFQASHLDLMCEDGGALLHDEVDVAQGNVLDLRFRGEERHEGGRHLLAQVAHEVRRGDDVHLEHDQLHARGQEVMVCSVMVCSGMLHSGMVCSVMVCSGTVCSAGTLATGTGTTPSLSLLGPC